LEKRKIYIIASIFIVVIILIIMIISITNDINKDVTNKQSNEAKTTTSVPKKDFKIIASTENKDLEPILMDYAKKNNINLQIDYASAINTMYNLNKQYDAVLCSNSVWFSLLNDKSSMLYSYGYSTKDAKSIDINPIVFGIKKSKVKELGFATKDVYIKDILNAIRSSKLNLLMPPVTETNLGASTYFTFLQSLTETQGILTLKNINVDKVQQDLKTIFSKIHIGSSNTEDLSQDVLNSDKYDAIVGYESSMINLNKKLEANDLETYYLIYPKDGVFVNDTPFAYVDNSQGKEDIFKGMQNYLLSDSVQQKLMETGRRTWYGGTNDNVDKNIFNPNWGIDTTKSLVSIKYPNIDVIAQSFRLYNLTFGKPSYTIFCLDFSENMAGQGNKQLVGAMKYILNKDEASKEMLQFSDKDKITVFPMSSMGVEHWEFDNEITSGITTKELINKISKEKLIFTTSYIYSTMQHALNITNGMDRSKYSNVSIVLMTSGNADDTYKKYLPTNKKAIPVYIIMLGNADESEINNIAKVIGAKVFDGRTQDGLLQAFTKIKEYNW